MNMPHSLEAEQSVLGAILLDGQNNMAKAGVKLLRPEHFYVKLHSDIYSEMSKMFAVGELIDIVTVGEKCLKANVFDSAEQCQSYLAKLIDMVPSISSIESYIDILDEKYVRRRLVTAAKEILEHSSGGDDKKDELIELAEDKIYRIRTDNKPQGLTSINAIVVDVLNELSELSSNPDKKANNGLKSGFPSIDKYTFGLGNSYWIVIAGRPGMGKTSFAMNMVTNAARIHPDKTICVFNMEMTKEELVKRMISSEGMISSSQMKTGRFSGKEWRNLADAAQVLSGMNILIDDSGTTTVNDIKSKLKRVDNLGLVVIDHLGLLSSGRRDLNRVNQVSEMTRDLKIMAKELNVPVITLSQFSRSAEKGKEKSQRPQLSDLRDSGTIEQDADVVLFLYRESYYEKSEENQRACECIIAKNRHGETATVPLMWDGQYTRFTDVEYIHADPRA